MDRKQQLLSLLINGEIEKSKLFKEFERIRTEGLTRNQQQFNSNWEMIQKKEQVYGDVGLSGQRDDIYTSYLTKKNAIIIKYETQVSLYKKACKLHIEENSLFCSLTVPMPYGLTTVEQRATLKQYSSKKSDAVIVDLAEKKFILFNAKLTIPSKFLGCDPIQNKEFADWIMDCLRGNALFAIFLATEWASHLHYEFD